MSNKPVRRDDVVISQLGMDETMLYDPQSEDLHVLNPTALLTWEHCDGEHTPEDIAAVIEAQCAGTAGRDIVGDVRKTLEVFLEKGLLLVEQVGG
jgi:hypothetical protein